jgi:hypothetical protein
MSKRGLGIAVAGGTAVLVLASGGIAMASPLPGHGASGGTFARPSWTRVVNTAGMPGAGNAKSGRPPVPVPVPVQGQPGWNRVSNTPGTTGAGNGKGGQGLPGSTPAPAPVTTGGQGGQGGLGGDLGGQGGQGGLGGDLGGQGGPGDLGGGLGGQGGPGDLGGGLGGQGGPGLPGSTPAAPVTTGGQGGEAPTG